MYVTVISLYGISKNLSASQQSNIFSKQTIETLVHRHETCSKLSIKTSERLQWRRPDAFVVYFEHNSHLVLVILLLLWTGNCALQVMQVTCAFSTHPFKKGQPIKSASNKRNTHFPNLFSVTTCLMKTRPYLGNLYLMKENEEKH